MGVILAPGTSDEATTVNPDHYRAIFRLAGWRVDVQEQTILTTDYRISASRDKVR